MSKRRLEIAAPIAVDRYLPATAFGDVVRQVKASGVVDSLVMWDQMTGWIPPSLWNTQTTPLAHVFKDADSFPDWNVMIGYGAALAPELGFTISMDAIRRGPAELTQTMLTTANVTEGKMVYMLGGGEIKQCQPFGWKRAEGLNRLEDFYKIFRAFLSSDRPIDFQGHHAKFDQAWIGGAMNHKPRIWGLGGGPRIIDLATTYADGFSSAVPAVWLNPEDIAQQIKQIKQQLESKGRDPEQFDFAIWCPSMLHEDEDLIRRAWDNPAIAWSTLIFGHIIQSDWLKEGLEPLMPPDWHYALKMLPMKVGHDEAMQLIKRVTAQHSEKSYFFGTPKQVASKIQACVDAGVTWVLPHDWMPIVLDPDDAATAINRTLEVCRILRKNNA